MDFDTNQDSDMLSVSLPSRIRCIRQNVKTERTIETSGDNDPNVDDFSIAQAFFDKPAPVSSIEQSQLQRLDSTCSSCNSSVTGRKDISGRLLKLRWWILAVALSLFGVLLCNCALKNDYEPPIEIEAVKSEIQARIDIVAVSLKKEMQSSMEQWAADAIQMFEKKFGRIDSSLKELFANTEESLLTSERLKAVCRKEYILNLIQTALEIYDADKTGLHDFALASAGGSVVVEKTSSTYVRNPSSYFGLPLASRANSPISVIQRRPGLGPGECWPFESHSGVLTIKLSQRANVTSVSYEHLPSRLNPDGNMVSAPKKFQIWGYDDVDEEHTRRMLGEYTYSDKGPSLQFFETQIFISPVAVRFVEFRVLSNYGSRYTCLYRFRVHGCKVDLEDSTLPF